MDTTLTESDFMKDDRCVYVRNEDSIMDDVHDLVNAKKQLLELIEDTSRRIHGGYKPSKAFLDRAISVEEWFEEMLSDKVDSLREELENGKYGVPYNFPNYPISDYRMAWIREQQQKRKGAL